MAAIIYTAKDRGELVSGHSELTGYSLDIALQTFSRSSSRKQSTITALSGGSTTTLHHIKHKYTVQTRQTDDVAIVDQMREFLSSVAAGEVFQLDPFGTVSVPDLAKPMKLTGNYSESMAPGKYYTFSFGVIEA